VAVRTQESNVLEPVIVANAVDVVEVKRQRLTLPL
jgi:hypothetical protein